MRRHACSQAPAHIAFSPKTHELFWPTTMLSLVNGVQILLSQSNFNRRSHLTSCHTPSMHRGRSPGEVGKQQNRAEVYAAGREVLATVKVSFDSESSILTPFTTDRDLQLSRKSIYPANERPWFISRQVSWSLFFCLVIPHASLSFKYFCFRFACDMSGLAFCRRGDIRPSAVQCSGVLPLPDLWEPWFVWRGQCAPSSRKLRTQGKCTTEYVCQDRYDVIFACCTKKQYW